MVTDLSKEKPEFQNDTTKIQTLGGEERGEGSKSELSLWLSYDNVSK